MSLRDVGHIFETHNDPQTVKFSIVDGLKTEGEIANSIGLFDDFNSKDTVLWTIVDIESKVFIGICGLKIHKDLNNSVNIIYRIHPEQRNKGYATEAVKAILDYSQNNLKLQKLMAQARKDNLPAHKIMLNTGFLPVVNETDEGWQTYKIEFKVF